MSQEYIAGRYITVDEGYKHLGFSTKQKQEMSEENRARYLNWIKEANNNVEADLFKYSDVMPLDVTSQAYSFAKSAALNWLVYKKRDLAGSINASAAKKDYNDDISRVIDLIKHIPSTKTYPIYATRTDSTVDLLIPYSQTQGFPPDILY